MKSGLQSPLLAIPAILAIAEERQEFRGFKDDA
jgi:hypothetical protein